MKTQPMLVMLTAVNLALVVVNLALRQPAVAATQGDGVLRARGLQIVDDEGRVRASIAVLPASRQPNGETYAETVLLRLITERGRPAVKMSASEDLAGVAFVGRSGTRDTYTKLAARGEKTSLTLRNEDGREQVITP